ncbi:pilus assembly protein TadG-related protein [Brevundimonas variabilis]|uniref:Putative Flp pilus-assembly TadG-like N-terminal domain-containing protein n=1 Tax=Brevundimonas variabilis TaxID=74312 RepID=A0A7W9CGG8_9CAUL|nr:TadE/TadG family type IV pilus assembly protein [Brevundimonas variabilis]MBB5745190.1 hypothetical protein [Brevundimonas variabilis]
MYCLNTFSKLCIKRYVSDQRGSVAIFFAIALPAALVIGLGAIELMNLTKDRSRLQDMADATALNAASQMRLAANDQLLSRAAAFAIASDSGLTARMDAPAVKFIHERGIPRGIEVALTARRQSFFGNLLPPGGFVIRAVARAQQLGRTPLCVLGTSASRSNVLNLPSGSIIARACMVYSNKDISLGVGSLIDAAAVQAAGAISGANVANSGTGATPLEDPLNGMFISSNPGACQHSGGVKVDKVGQSVQVDPGIHCRHFDIENGTLFFRPGVHHLKSGQLQLKKGAKIEGENVTLVIWKNLEVKFDDGQVPLLSLTGSQGGAGEAGHWAGFALAIDPARGGDMSLNFREIRKLEGVVYAPTTRLIVPGGIDPAEVTPWTVIVAQDLRVEGGRRLQINADYASSAVPVPDGVGNKADGGAPVQLTH